jgi:hypothetical protein
MRTWHILLIIVVLSGIIFYRNFALESRVDALYKTISKTAQSASKTSDSGAPVANDLDKRLLRLEAKYEALNQHLQQISNGEGTLDKDTLAILEKMLSSKKFDERVLSVMDAEKQKAIDAQLKWHRDDLVKVRMEALNVFAVDQKLSSGQLAALRAALEDEADKMIEILRTPALLTDHEKGLAAWGQLLRQTDKDAAEVLNDQQTTIFKHLRRLEQQALMPWLPEKDRS